MIIKEIKNIMQMNRKINDLQEQINWLNDVMGDDPVIEKWKLSKIAQYHRCITRCMQDRKNSEDYVINRLLITTAIVLSVFGWVLWD